MEKGIQNNGTSSEVEILEFRAGGNSYGLNVNDIKEILPYQTKPTPVPNSHPYIEGIIMPRDFIIPIINFKKSLELEDTDEKKNEMLIVTGLYQQNIAIHVDSVLGIHRKRSTEIIKAGKKLTTTQKGVVSGIFKINDKRIEIVDIRNLIKIINPELVMTD